MLAVGVVVGFSGGRLGRLVWWDRLDGGVELRCNGCGEIGLGRMGWVELGRVGG